MFRLYGKQVELYRYIVRAGGEEISCINEEHRDEVIAGLGDLEYTVEPIEQSGNEWMEEMEFDSYEAAQKALEIGKNAYLQQQVASDPITQIELALVEIYELIGG